MNNEIIKNPIVWSDIPDPSVIRVEDTYYMSSTTMHMSPGVPIMKSMDLVNWQIVNYVYEILENNDKQNLQNGQNEYSKGSWASSLRYYNGTYYLAVASFSTGKTYIFQTKDIENGKWSKYSIDGVYHDMSLLFDEGHVYMVYGGGDIRLIELTADATAIKTDGLNQIIIPDSSAVIGEKVRLPAEGAHIHKINSKYYIFLITWPEGENGIRTELVYRADKIDGPYEGKVVLSDSGIAQGGVVDTVDGDWYALLFGDRGAVGRIPYLVPVKWENDWPVYGIDGKAPKKMQIPVQDVESNEKFVSSDEFDVNTSLDMVWQWNHNPDNEYWSLKERPGYLRLTNGTKATHILDARNILTQRTFGPECSGNVAIDVTHMKDGDIAGFAAFQKKYGYVAVKMDENSKSIVMINGSSEEEIEVEKIPISEDQVYFKIDFDFKNQTDKAYFYYSLNGLAWKSIGRPLQMEYTIPHFMGYRFALFNFATKSIGGHVDFDYFKVENQISATGSVQTKGKGLAKVPGYNNPLISHKFGADPNAMVYNGSVYIYLTNDKYEYDEDGNVIPNTYGNINTITIISSEDLVNWTDHGAIPVAGPSGAAKWATQSWAVALAHKKINHEDKFFLYFSNNGSGVGVLTADTPVGPWIDPINKPLIDRSIPGTEGVPWVFDPAVLVDDDGEGYLYFGGGIPGGKELTQEQAANPKSARVIKLSDSMISTEGEAILIDAPFMFESSGIHKREDKYYYSYSTNFVGKRTESDPKQGEIAYMISDHPMGPFTFVDSILKNPSVFFDVGGNNHQDFFEFKGQWYITYHAQTLAKALGTVQGYRSPHINKIEYNENGHIKNIIANMDGAPQVANLDPYKRVEAETIAWHAGISTENSKTPGNIVKSINQNITDINNGDWLALSKVDFGEYGAKAFEVNIASTVGGTIEIHLDSLDGEIIGTLDVTPTGGEQQWKVLKTDVKHTSGVHNLFFKFCGRSEENLFNIDHWKFTPNKTS